MTLSTYYNQNIALVKENLKRGLMVQIAQKELKREVMDNTDDTSSSLESEIKPAKKLPASEASTSLGPPAKKKKDVKLHSKVGCRHCDDDHNENDCVLTVVEDLCDVHFLNVIFIK